jgi:hypothetical protein
MRNSDKPILITGSHRSGTTWVGKMLTLGKYTLLINEPFNINDKAYKFNGLAKYWFTYAPELPYKQSKEAFNKVLSRATSKVFSRNQIQYYLRLTRRGKLVIKDPIACFSSEWLSHNFDLETIVLIRHPAAFALSLKRKKWSLPFDHLLKQKKLMEDHFIPFMREIENPPKDIIEQAALLWKLINHVLLKYTLRNSEWILKKHEEISLEPVNQIRDLYDKVNLSWNDTIKTKIKEFTGSHNPTHPKEGSLHSLRRDSIANIKRWKKFLSETEIKTIYDMTYPVANKIYKKSDW